LNEGCVVFNGTPADLAAKVQGKVWKASITSQELDFFKTKYQVISAVPSEAGYELRIVAENFADGPAESVEPNLEDAYVYFMQSANGQH
jgi:hypothetical protein